MFLNCSFSRLRSLFHEHFTPIFWHQKLQSCLQIFWRQNIGTKCWWNWQKVSQIVDVLVGASLSGKWMTYQIRQFRQRFITSERFSQSNHLQLLKKLLRFFQASFVVERQDPGMAIHLEIHFTPFQGIESKTRNISLWGLKRTLILGP